MFHCMRLGTLNTIVSFILLLIALTIWNYVYLSYIHSASLPYASHPFFIVSNDINNLLDDLIRNITTYKSNPVYRVGNILLHYGPHWEQDLLQIKNNTQNQWNGTILHHYLNLLDTTMSEFSKPKLRESIEWYISRNSDVYRPTPNELLIHFRAGDVVEKEWFLNEPFIGLINNTISKYKNINKITFLCALHFGGYVGSWRSFVYNATAEYENKRKLRLLFRQIITHFGFNQQIKSYQLISNPDTDRDLITAVTARYLYTQRCRSTFSKILSEVNSDGYRNVYGANQEYERVLCPNKFCCKVFNLTENFQRLKRKLKDRHGLLVTTSRKEFVEHPQRVSVEGRDTVVPTSRYYNDSMYDEIKAGRKNMVWRLLHDKERWSDVTVGMILKIKDKSREPVLFRKVKDISVIVNPYAYMSEFKQAHPDQKQPNKMVLQFEFEDSG
eukprot:296184_1